MGFEQVAFEREEQRTVQDIEKSDTLELAVQSMADLLLLTGEFKDPDRTLEDLRGGSLPAIQSAIAWAMIDIARSLRRIGDNTR